MSASGWIGVDLDATLAHYPAHFPAIGPPIPEMVRKVKAELAKGVEVRIMTARVSHVEGAQGDNGTVSSSDFVNEQRALIEAWCLEHLGRKLPVTCMKDFQMIELWDDRCKQVVPNSGRFLEDCYREA